MLALAFGQALMPGSVMRCNARNKHNISVAPQQAGSPRSNLRKAMVVLISSGVAYSRIRSGSFGSLMGVGVVVFASTNIDDIFILSAFFADIHLARRSVVNGQFVGIGALVLVSGIAALLAVAVPEGW